jgi:hypothetical protein
MPGTGIKDWSDSPVPGPERAGDAPLLSSRCSLPSSAPEFLIIGDILRREAVFPVMAPRGTVFSHLEQL